jgi:TolA-binding protein
VRPDPLLLGEFAILAKRKYIVTLALAFAVLLTAGVVNAAVITGANLVPNHQASRLVLSANGPLEYQVDLADPQTVVLHFLNARLEAPLPDTTGDPLISEISARPEGGGLSITVRTRIPGVTVLPLYEAQARRLTLELGGPPTLEEKVPSAKTQPIPKPVEEPAPVPAKKLAPPPEQNQTPTAVAQQSIPPAPATAEPLAKSQPSPQPAPVAKKVETKPAPQEEAQPKPKKTAPTVVAQPAKPKGPQPQVLRMRVGSHAEYSRLVLDADAELSGLLYSQDQEAILSLERGKSAPDIKLPKGDERIQSLELMQADPLKLRLRLARPLARHQLFKAGQGDKLVLDLRLITPEAWAKLKNAQKKEQKAETPAQQEAQAKAIDKAELAEVESPEKLKVTPDLPVTEPDQTPQQLPDPATDGQVIAEKGQASLRQKQAAAPSAAPAAEAPAAAQPIDTTAQAQSRPIQASLGPDAAAAPQKSTAPVKPERFPEIPMASMAETSPEVPLARGKVPPVPPPPVMARPRGAIKVQPDVAPPTSAKQVIGKVAQAEADRAARGAIPSPPPVQEKTAATVQQPLTAAAEQPPPGAPAAPPGAPQTAQAPGTAPMPAPPEARLPQAARLGAKGQMDREARALFNRAKEDLDGRQYAEAVNGFEQFLLKYPKHSLAGEATYRLADAFFYLREREMNQYFMKAMENYQKAIDLYPESDQVPWAMLQMGRVAMLSGEAFKAQGYFQIVIEDYPKSEYVPLAMVNQGRSYVADGKWSRALDEFRNVAEKYPDSRFRKDADWGQAQALFGMARYERASYLLQDMDRRFPKLRLTEPELLYYIGEAEFQLKRYPEARRYFLWALNIMPDIRDNDIILTRVGDSYQFEGAHKAAKVIYNQVVKLFPDSDGGLVARIRLAESPAKDKDHPWDIFQVAATTDALKTYNEILKKYPTRPVAELAQLKLGVYYYKKKNYAKALAVLEQLLQMNPRSSFRPEVEYTLDLTTVGYLKHLRKENKPIALMDAYLRNRASLRRPNSNQMLEILAWAYEHTGLNMRAAKLYQVLISRGLDKLEYHVALARTLMIGRDYEGVLKALPAKIVARLTKEAAVEGRSLRGRALAGVGKCAQAAPLLQQILEQKFEYPWVALDYAALGRCLIKMQKIISGLKALDEANRRFDPGDRLEKYLVAMESGAAARRIGQTERALGYYQRAEGLSGDARGRAQAIYEQASTLRTLERNAEVAKAYQRLVKLKVQPWTAMAQRHLTDMKLAPRLATVGTGPLNEKQ